MRTVKAVIDVIGEALIDLIEAPDGRFDALPGGGPANVALGLAKLDAHCRFLGRFSTDRFGELSRQRLAESGVDLTASVTADEASTLAIVALDESQAARYSFYTNGTVDWAWQSQELLTEPPAAIHVGSLAAAIQPGRDIIDNHITALYERDVTTISYDPNIRPALGFESNSEMARVQAQTRRAHLVKISDEDLAFLYPGATFDQQVERIRSVNPGAHIIVTCGASGAMLLRSDGDQLHVDALPVTVVDTVGAGDAFAAAMLAELAVMGALGSSAASRLASLSRDDWDRVLRFAAGAAAITCTRAGACPPSRREINRVMLLSGYGWFPACDGAGAVGALIRGVQLGLQCHC